MRGLVVFIALSAILPSAASAQSWSASVSTGPFIFGSFAERSATITSGSGSTTTRSRLSAATRVGGAADIERELSRRLGIRLDAAWTRAQLSVKSTSGASGVAFDAGHISVTSFALPLVFHVNRAGAFRFHLMGGPAYAIYEVSRRAVASPVPLFEGTRARFGVSAGFGAGWWVSDRLGVEWQAADTITESPLQPEEVAANGRGVKLMKPHNGHTTIGIRYRF